MATILDLKATSESSFNIGISSTAVKLKNVSGVLHLRDKLDSGFIDLEAGNITGSILTVDEVKVTGDSIELNSDAAGAGADWKMYFARPNSGMSAAVTYTFPAVPTNGYFLTTDASGNMSWQAVSSPSVTEKITVNTTSFNFSNIGSASISLFTLPALAVIHRVEIIVDTAFDAGEVRVGYAGDEDAYMTNAQSDLTDQARFVSESNVVADVNPVPLELFNTGISASVGVGRVLVHYSIPA